MTGTVLVTGASRGIGLAAARAMAKAGYTVYGTSRNLEAAAGAQSAEIRWLPLDLTDEDSIRSLLSLLPPVDVLINNAGESLMGAVEEIPVEKMRRLFELLLFGNIQLIQGVLPRMRENGRGLILNIGSLAELNPVPASSVYAGAKAALHILSAGLRQELRPFGIRVVTVAPSFVSTSIRQERICNEHSPYARLIRAAGAVRDADIQNGSPPEAVAKRIVKIAGLKNPASFYAVGKNARLLQLANRFLPEALREAAVRRHFKL